LRLVQLLHIKERTGQLNHIFSILQGDELSGADLGCGYGYQIAESKKETSRKVKAVRP
jgi:hypothetical protein